MEQPLYQVREDQSAHVIELLLPRHIDGVDFDRLNESLLGLLLSKPRGRWVVDLSHLGYTGSSLLGLMVNIRQQVGQADGRLALCGLSPRLMEVFRTCCLERLFVIRPDRAAAVREVLQG